MKGLPSGENATASCSTSYKRKSAVLADTDNNTGEEPVSKRSKGGISGASTQSGEHSGEGVSEGPQPPAIPEKHPVNVQNAIYAAERLSSSPEITHSINFILRGEILVPRPLIRDSRGSRGIHVLGTTIYITWSDRQSVIRTRGFSIIDNLPHFLVILLIMQRFDLARWGFFTSFEGSEIHPVEAPPELYVLEATFIPGKTIKIFPHADPVHKGFNLVGRSTTAAGAMNAANEIPSGSEEIRKGNDTIVKFSWPEETRVSEAEIIEKAKRIGEGNDLVRDHIPEMLGNIDPPYMTCSTKIIRTFLGLDTAGARVLRVIAFSRLRELRYLDEEDMLMAFLDCFFCEVFRSLCVVL